ncbi:MAG: hypothetical protein ABI488_20240 [Polyangiaceae bacterium]
MRRAMRRSQGSWGIVAALAVAACSSTSGESVSGSGSFPGGSDFGSGGSGSVNLGPSSNAGAAAVVVPPEQEEDLSYRAPVVSGRWVWTANPTTGKVAVVDAKSFGVRLADAGVAPTFLTALPSSANTSRALVINTGSHDATLLSAGATGAVKAVGPIPLSADVNAWQVSRTGKFALAWTDSHALTPDPTQGYQDISVVDLRGASPLATRLVVGFLPSRVFIDDAETHAYVVATSGITVIDLVGSPAPRVLKEEPVTSDPHEDASTRDVSVTPDGSYALIRHDGSNLVTLLDLATGDLSPVSLPGAITDLDLAPDAKSALAVVRGDDLPPAQSAGSAGAGGEGGEGVDGEPAAAGSGSSILAILPIPGIFSDPTVFDTVSVAGEVFGLVNIAPQGSQALLYTNAVSNSHVTLLDTAHGTAHGATYLSHRTIDVHGYVHEVFPSPDGAYAIASLLPTTAGGKPGFAAIPVTSALPPRVQTTDAPVFAVAQSAGSAARAVITVSDGKTNFAAYIVRMPELVVDTVKLPSRPLTNATGLVPDAGVAYIAQEHPQGRITFINLETGVPRTITGFEISAKVTDGN